MFELKGGPSPPITFESSRDSVVFLRSSGLELAKPMKLLKAIDPRRILNNIERPVLIRGRSCAEGLVVSYIIDMLRNVITSLLSVIRKFQVESIHSARDMALSESWPVSLYVRR